jgi:hypothetical protein
MAAMNRVLLLLLVAGLCGCASDGFPVLTGEYLGQTPPGDTAEVFAPGIISTGLYTRDVAITPDGKEFYFSVVLGNHDYFAIMVSKLVDGQWTEPAIAPFSGQYKDLEPAISPDGQQFFFFSYRPREAGGEVREDSDIWVMDRLADGWGEPRNLGAPINTDTSEFFPSVTVDGTLYFTRDGENRSSHIYSALRVKGGGGEYAEPVRLGAGVNADTAQYNSFVAPDESYLIFAAYGAADSRGGSDYYISFRNDDDSWTGPINMGDSINTAGALEYSPYVTPDGKYFFFMAARGRFADGFETPPETVNDLLGILAEPRNGLPDIYWIDAGFIQTLKPD